MVNYSNSKIYKLCCNNTDITDIYVGSTVDFGNRKRQHKSVCDNESSNRYNLQVYKFIRANGGWNAWNMIQIEAYNATDKRSLEARERHWIETLKPSLNKYIPTRTQREWCEDNKEHVASKHKQYYQEHKEQKLAKQKKYNQDNREQIKQYKKQHRQNNKEALSAKSKQYYQNNKEALSAKVECDCGCVVIKKHLLRHTRTAKHKFYQTTYDFIYF